MKKPELKCTTCGNTEWWNHCYDCDEMICGFCSGQEFCDSCRARNEELERDNAK